MGFVVAGQMPFADEARLVTSVFESLGERDFLEFHGLAILGPFKNFALGFALVVIYEPGVRRELAGHDRCTGRGADRTGGVGVGKPHSSLGQAVDMRSLMDFMAVTTEILPSQVVDEDEQDVRACRYSNRCNRPDKKNQINGFHNTKGHLLR